MTTAATTLSPEAQALHFPQHTPLEFPAHAVAARAGREPDAAETMLHGLAKRYGREIARDELDYREAHGRLAIIALAHWQIGPDRFDDVMPRIDDTLCRYADADALSAARDIRMGVRILLDQRAPTASLRTRAYELSAARLLRPVCDAIVQDEIAKRLGGTIPSVAPIRGAHGRHA